MMAAFVRHVLSTEGPKILANCLKSIAVIPSRGVSCRKKVKRLPKRFIQNVQIQPKLAALEARGFLRNIVPYEPPADAAEKLKKLFEEIVGTTDLATTLEGEKKFQLLTALNQEFSYLVPNSQLYEMTTLGNVFDFYMTPVNTTVPYDRFKEMDLPPNVHIIHDYVRFHPDTDTKFGGISAFPRSSTLVTGLRAKKKYKGHDAGNPWFDI